VSVEVPIIHTCSLFVILLKNSGAACGNFDGQIKPFAKFSLRKSSNASCCAGDNEYGDNH